MPVSYRRPFAILGVATALALSAAQATAGDAGSSERLPDWLKPAATKAITYGSIYTAVLAAEQGTRLAIVTLAPIEWLGVTQTFGIPLVMVPLMAELIPEVRQWAPKAVDYGEYMFVPDGATAVLHRP